MYLGKAHRQYVHSIRIFYECIAFKCLSISSFLSIFLEIFLLSMLMMTKRYYYSYIESTNIFLRNFLAVQNVGVRMA